MEQHSLLFFLFLTFSVQIHARDGQFFFSKTSRSEASPKVSSATSIAEEPATALPPQTNHNGYGLYGRDLDQYFPSTTAATANYNYNTNTPSSFTNAEFSTTESYENKDRRNANNNIPSTFTDAEFLAAENYKTKYDNPSSFGTNPEFPSQTYENKEYNSYVNNIPSTFPDEEFNRGSYENNRVPNYPNYDKQQHGMSDTRFMENGKYFYDVNAERNRREYKNEAEGYENSAKGMNQESQEEYDPWRTCILSQWWDTEN